MRSDLPADVWWRQVAVVCDDGFAEQLRTVDPARVPARQVTGGPVATKQPRDGAAEYEIPTDSGTLAVTTAAVRGRWVVVGADFRRTIG
ncbi:hypothetical protein [Micromonospora tarapacensis]|uniref:hypothetical protein n=1 Tax=Micromonospora tarapacensis TaxID=2835305 RepID=UPI001E640E9F|nr:hypothetical protein [Micromonospora tarapacensis]